ncbi:MAG: hypothetical protein K2Y12_11145 [Chitinophagaceae bacterium]|jgi:hypothetical protein|nr:hypothetical protein [Chitinophagaceae bacterium]
MKLVHTFYGEESNAMLAPRGVCLSNDILAVSDTGQNRVLIWNNIFDYKHKKATVKLEASTEQQLQKGTCNANSLQYPSGIWTNGEILIIADAWNHRVLIWKTFPTKNNQAADVVIGQPNFDNNQPNITGLGNLPTAQSLYWPYGVYSNGTELWIADTGNRRVLYFSEIPATNFAVANAVIGQATFNEKDYDPANAVWPYSVKISNKGEMLIADTQYYRVLYWNNWKDSLTVPAKIIFGQADMQSNGQNQYQLKPNAKTLNWCYDVCFWNNGIAIADTGNSRVVIHNQIPTENNALANFQLGQPNFETHGETSLSFTSKIENEMYWPFAVNTDNNVLVLADTGNHRILIYKNLE